MKRLAAMARGALVAAALVAIVALGRTDPQRPSGPSRDPASRATPANAQVVRIGGAHYVSMAGLARLLGGVRRWRADLRQLEFVAGEQTLLLAVDNPYVVAGEKTWRLEAPVRSLGGDVVAPMGVLELIPVDSTREQLTWDSAGARVRRVLRAGAPPRWQRSGTTETLIWTTARSEEASVVARDLAHFRISIPGASGVGLDSLGADALVRTVRTSRAADEREVELVISPRAKGWRLQREVEPGRVVWSVSTESRPGDERFAIPTSAGSRKLECIVLDPAHGGEDAGARAGGMAEKDAVLSLARELRVELVRRGVPRVQLTRDEDVERTREQRAEAANRARPDVVLVLHVDGWTTPRARGVTLYVPKSAEPSAAGDRTLRWSRWDRAAGAHAADARAVADVLARTMESRSLGPVRITDRAHSGLVGVDAPVVVAECATWTSPSDRARLSSGDGVRETVRALADALMEWSRGE